MLDGTAQGEPGGLRLGRELLLGLAAYGCILIQLLPLVSVDVLSVVILLGMFMRVLYLAIRRRTLKSYLLSSISFVSGFLLGVFLVGIAECLGSAIGIAESMKYLIFMSATAFGVLVLPGLLVWRVGCKLRPRRSIVVF
jgi:hypothetical protein